MSARWIATANLTAAAAALEWISGLLRELDIPCQVVGGLAARCHGASRPIADIDLYVPDEASLVRLAAAARDELVPEPNRHRDEHWDLTFLVLQRGAWRVEVAAAADARVWDHRTQAWCPAAIRFDESVLREVAGEPAPPGSTRCDAPAGAHPAPISAASPRRRGCVTSTSSLLLRRFS